MNNILKEEVDRIYNTLISEGNRWQNFKQVMKRINRFGKKEVPENIEKYSGELNDVGYGVDWKIPKSPKNKKTSKTLPRISFGSRTKKQKTPIQKTQSKDSGLVKSIYNAIKNNPKSTTALAAGTGGYYAGKRVESNDKTDKYNTFKKAVNDGSYMNFMKSPESKDRLTDLFMQDMAKKERSKKATEYLKYLKDLF